MKMLSVLSKSLKEQLRSYWVLLLTLSMGPFFILIYFLITESSKPSYKVLVINEDNGIITAGHRINHGNDLINNANILAAVKAEIPFTIEKGIGRDEGIEAIKNKKADALIIIGDSFSNAIEGLRSDDGTVTAGVEFIGDLTSTNYLISAVWANEFLNEYVLQASGNKRVVRVKETALGTSGILSEFDMVVPGILIFSLIMLMFTASIAFVSEVENRTIMRLKLSKLTASGFLGGISIVQLLVGLLSVLLTLLTAILLGFKYSGSPASVILVAGLTSFSIIAFSLIIAALTRSAGEVLVVGNFPFFLFAFFTGAAFPIKSKALFTIAGYPVNIQGLMTPTHAVSAFNKILIMDMDLPAVMPEIIMIIILTILYFITGGALFRHRHLKLA